MHHKKGCSGEDAGPEGAAALRPAGAAKKLVCRKRRPEGGATGAGKSAQQGGERGPGANPEEGGELGNRVPVWS